MQSLWGDREDGTESISHSPEYLPAVGFYSLSYDNIVTLYCGLHGSGVLLPTPGAAFYVGI
jgi:hypothetical protein